MVAAAVNVRTLLYFVLFFPIFPNLSSFSQSESDSFCLARKTHGVEVGRKATWILALPLIDSCMAI